MISLQWLSTYVYYHLAYGCMLPADLILVLIALGTLPPDAEKKGNFVNNCV